MKRRLRAYVRREGEGDGERDDAVDVHAQLEWGEVEAGQEGEEAVEAGDFVEEEGEGGEFGAGAEGH